jgi:hypothetical protein
MVDGGAMKHVTRLAAVLAAVVLLGVVSPGAAQAIIPDTPPPDRTLCDPNDWPPGVLNRQFTWITSAEVDVVLTQFLAVNVAPGTSGTRTDMLTKVNSVTVTIGASTEINATAGVIFAKVSTKIGFSVQVQAGSTETVSNTMVWSFSQPGYYGLYKGTRRVAGTAYTMRCGISLADSKWYWSSWNLGAVPYVTFANIEEGTITCDVAAPPGSLRELAKRQLGC